MRPDNEKSMQFCPLSVGLCFMWDGNHSTIPEGFAPMDGNIYNGFQTTAFTYYTPIQSNETPGTLKRSGVSSDGLTVTASGHDHNLTGTFDVNGVGDGYTEHTHDASNLKMAVGYNQITTVRRLQPINTLNYFVPNLVDADNDLPVSGVTGGGDHTHEVNIKTASTGGEHSHEFLSNKGNSTDARYRFRPKRTYFSWIVWVGIE